MKHLIFILLILSTLFCGCKSGKVEILNKPLYQDPTGWKIWTARSGELIVYYYYTRPLSVMPEAAKAQLSDDFGQVFQDMEREGSFKYFGFVIVSSGSVSFWPEQSFILLTYIDHGDTLQARSEELFVIQKCDLQPVYSRDRMLQIPSGLDDIFNTPRGWQVLFAKFPLTSQPDAVLYCNVENTLSH